MTNKPSSTKYFEVDATMSFPSIFESPNTIQRLKMRDEKTLQKLLAVSLVEFQDNLNIDRKMNSQQAMTAVSIIVDKYRSLTLHDFAKFFRQALTGEHGKVFGRFDVETLCLMLDSYCDAREEHRETHEATKKHKIINAPMTDERREMSLKYLKRIRERLEAKQTKNEHVRTPDIGREGQFYFELERVFEQHSGIDRKRFSTRLSFEQYFQTVRQAKAASRLMTKK